MTTRTLRRIMDNSHNGTGGKKRIRRPWTKDKVHTAVRLTPAEFKMLKGLVKHLGISQNRVISTALQELHERHQLKKAA